jgi:hypothetical protein
MPPPARGGSHDSSQDIQRPPQEGDRKHMQRVLRRIGRSEGNIYLCAHTNDARGPDGITSRPWPQALTRNCS